MIITLAVLGSLLIGFLFGQYISFKNLQEEIEDMKIRHFKDLGHYIEKYTKACNLSPEDRLRFRLSDREIAILTDQILKELK